ncbi:MAG: hypothetical protein K0Q55_549 [Verrucomicrobia bacterium]|jgi:hypothetical protein|nr:hypothetical protein [Verrucomicrobiota bacterium]
MKRHLKSLCLLLAASGVILTVSSNYADDDPPTPPGGGGGGSTNAPPNPYSVSGLKLYQPQFDGEYLRFWILEAETNAVYDLFLTPNLETNHVWYHWGRTEAGVTNFLAYYPGTTNAFFMLGTMQDSDSDGLTDAYELLVSLTPTNSSNTNLDVDSDGIPDLTEISYGLNPTQTDSPLSLTIAAPAGYSLLP